YVAQLPWALTSQAYALLATSAATVVVALLYLGIGSLHFRRWRPVASAHARLHLGVLLAALALTLTWGAALDPAETVAGLHGALDGAALQIRATGAGSSRWHSAPSGWSNAARPVSRRRRRPWARCRPGTPSAWRGSHAGRICSARRGRSPPPRCPRAAWAADGPRGSSARRRTSTGWLAPSRRRPGRRSIGAPGPGRAGRSLPRRRTPGSSSRPCLGATRWRGLARVSASSPSPRPTRGPRPVRPAFPSPRGGAGPRSRGRSRAPSSRGWRRTGSCSSGGATSPSGWDGSPRSRASTFQSPWWRTVS